MFRVFAITTSNASIRLNGTGQGELTFTVSNALGRPVRGRAVIEPEGVTSRVWLALGGEAEREFPPDGTHQYTVKVNVPPGTSPGEYAFHLSVVNVANSDEEFAIGPSAIVQVPAPPASAPKRKLPIAWLALVAGILVIALTTFFVLRGRGGKGSGSDEPKQVAAKQVAAKQAFLSFDGKKSYIDLGDPKALSSISDTITIEAWIRPRALDGLRNIVVHGSEDRPARSTAEVYFRINSGKYQVGTFVSNADFFTSADVPITDVGRWVYLAGVFDGDRWILYRDGELLAFEPQSYGHFRVDAPWGIGAGTRSVSGGGGRERFFQGDIRDVRIWNIPRGQEEVRADMDRTFTGKESGLVGYWPLNEGKSAVARDLSPSKIDGLISEGHWGEE